MSSKLLVSVVLVVLSTYLFVGALKYLESIKTEGPPGPAEAVCTKYVSKTGSINGAVAKTTIQEGIADLVAGDVLCVGPGLYGEKVSVTVSGTATQPITIRAFDPLNKPTLDGEYKLPTGTASNMNKPFYSNTKCEEHWENPSANLGPAPKQACFVWGYMVAITGSHIVWDGINITRSRGHGLLLGNYNGPATTVQSVRFKNSEISNIRNEGVYIAGIKGAQFSNNIVRDTNNFASYSRRAPNIDWSGSAPTWSGFGPGWSGGIYLRFSEDVEIINNKIFHNWGEGLGTGLFNNITLRTKIQGNEIYDNMSGQLYMTNGSHVIADKNIIYHTGDAKYWLNDSSYSNCISFASEDGEMMTDLTVTNNFISGCATLISFGQFRAESKMTNIKIYNNTFIRGGTVIHSSSALSALSQFLFINNLIFSPRKISTLPTVPQMVVHHNLWPSAAPANLQGIGDVINANPGLTNPSYKPTAGSFDPTMLKIVSAGPPVNAGFDLPEVTSDYFGSTRPIGSGMDIGAHEL